MYWGFFFFQEKNGFRVQVRFVGLGEVYKGQTRHRTDTIRVVMMGVKKRYRRLGIDLLLFDRVWELAPPKGFRRAELAWVLELSLIQI